MKRFLAGLAAAAVAVVVSSSGASASNGATVTHFTATYKGLVGDINTCSGSHIVKTAPNASVKDSETCIVSGKVSTYSAGIFTSGVPCPASCGVSSGNQCGSFPPYAAAPGAIDALIYWVSDFSGVLAISWTQTLTRNPDGTFTDEIVSYYSTS